MTFRVEMYECRMTGLYATLFIDDLELFTISSREGYIKRLCYILNYLLQQSDVDESTLKALWKQTDDTT